MEAVKLLKAGKLPDTSKDCVSGQQDPGAIELKIYTPPTKYFTVEKNGMKKCYSLQILCYPSENYPYRVSNNKLLCPDCGGSRNRDDKEPYEPKGKKDRNQQRIPSFRGRMAECSRRDERKTLR